MRCLRFQQLYIPVQRTWKLPLWTISFAILIIHLIKAATAFWQNTHLQLSLAVRACSSLVRLFLRQDLQGPCTGSSHTSVTCLMYVHDWQVTDHVSTCCHLYSAECFGYFPTSLMGKKKKRIRRSQGLQSNNSLPCVPIKTYYTQATRCQQPWQQPFNASGLRHHHIPGCAPL